MHTIYTPFPVNLNTIVMLIQVDCWFTIAKVFDERQASEMRFLTEQNIRSLFVNGIKFVNQDPVEAVFGKKCETKKLGARS